MKHAVKAEISAARIWLVGPAISLVFLLLIFLTYQKWHGVWPQASAAVNAALLFAGPLIAAATATSVLKRTNSGFDSVIDAGTLPPLRAEWAALMGRLPYAVIPPLMASIAVTVVNLASAPSGFLWPSYLVLTCAFAIECVGVGFLLGRLTVPRWFPPVASALLIFGRVVWFTGGSPLSSSLMRVVKSGPLITNCSGTRSFWHLPNASPSLSLL